MYKGGWAGGGGDAQFEFLQMSTFYILICLPTNVYAHTHIHKHACMGASNKSCIHTGKDVGYKDGRSFLLFRLSKPNARPVLEPGRGIRQPKSV